MKRVFLVSALVFGLGFSAAAADVVLVMEHSVLVNQEKEYKAIESSAISSEALAQIGTKYAGYSLEEAAVALDGEYKLVLSKEGSKVTALFSSAGDFIKKI